MSRGRKWLDQLGGLLRAYGYAVTESTHDCGELGGLAQRRRRFVLVARHMEQVSEVLYEPPTKPHQTIGDVFGELPLPTPSETAGGPMHRLPKLAALNWVRLALIRAGKDWRDLPESVALSARSGRMNGGFGVNDWNDAGHTVVGEGSVRNTWASVSDPRSTCDRREGALGVQDWDGAPSTAVIGHATIHNWPAAVVDPRLVSHGWTVDGRGKISGGYVDLENKRPVHLVIRAADGTWHRPMTTLELAALQGFPTKVRGQWIELDGRSHKAWRQRIGNAVPPPAAEAIARQMALTLAASADGSLHMSSSPIWVAPQQQVSA
jgi:site-specific DNA-cytosine methylase